MMQQQTQLLPNATGGAASDCTRILGDLLEAGDPDIAPAIDNALGQIGGSLGLDGVSLVRVDTASGLAPAHSWRAERPASTASEDGAAVLCDGAEHGVILVGWGGPAQVRAAGQQGPALGPVVAVMAAMLRRADRAAAADRSSDRYRAILDSLPDIVTEIDAEGRYLHVQAGNPHQLVTAPKDMVGRLLEEVLPPEVAAQRRATMQELDSGLRPESRVFSLPMRDGTSWYHVSAARIGAGPQAAYLFCSRDVTRDIEQRRAMERLGQITRRTSSLVAMTDLEQRVEWVNDAFARLSGHVLDDLRGQPIGSLLLGDRTDPETTVRVRAALLARAPIEADILNEDRSGTPYVLHAFIEPLQGDTGDFAGFMVVATDITDRRRMSDDLLARTREADSARRQLADAIESLEDGFVIYDAQDRLVLCNRRLRVLYSHTAPVLEPGRSFAEIIRYAIAHGQFPRAHGTVDDWLASRADRTIGKGVSFERALPDGRILRVVERLTPNGERIGIHSDITDLKKAEKRLLDVIEGAQACTWEWDVRTGQQIVNSRWAETLGYTLAELSPVTYDVWRGLVHPDDVANAERMVEECFAGLTDVYRAEYRQRHKDGHWIWLLDRGRITERDAEGYPSYMVGVQFEIGEQKAREAALSEAKIALERALADRDSAEQRFYDIAAVNDGWFWEQDANLRFSFLSQAPFFDRLGIPQDSIIGRTREEWLANHADVLASADWPALLAAMQAHAPFHDFVYRAPLRPGYEERWFRISGAPVFDAAGGFAGYRGVGAEVTELVLARARAEEASRTKSMFLANMSHEIRTPLNGVLGMAEVLDGMVSDSDHKRMIGTIRRSGESLLNILNDILDMSKIEAGKMELEAVPFRLGDLAERVEELHALRAEEKGIAFEVMIGSGAELPRLGDPHRVQQILHNLVSNAIKFTERGEVAVSLGGKQGRPLSIEVRDTGIGMSPAHVAKLHDEFSQADNSVTRRFGGTGLGMAITRTLVDLMGGTIEVVSAENRGTTIRIALPLPIAESPAPRAAEPAAGPVDLAGIRVLAADDNLTNRTVLAMMLKLCGAEVTLCVDGAEVVKAWAPGLFDVVLLDIAMPVMDGPTALREIRAREEETGQASVPVIAVTANAMSHQVAEYIVLGFDTCVAKPINSIDLSIAIRSLTAPH